jgi:hypothetical protein
MEEKEINEIETMVRLILGQTDFGAILDENQRPKHLRFNMSGNRDSEEGENANVEIWKKFYPFFGLNLSIRRAYNDERLFFTGFIFTFHKGCGSLIQIICDNEDEEDECCYFYREKVIKAYGGDGTVDILKDLIIRFAGKHYGAIYNHIKNTPEDLLLDATYNSKYGLQTIEYYC